MQQEVDSFWRHLTRPAARCNGAGNRSLVKSVTGGSAHNEHCAGVTHEPQDFDQAFGPAIRAALLPWNNSIISMQMLHTQLMFAAPWCRVQACVVRAKLYVRGWRRSSARPGPLLRETLIGSRQYAAILGIAGVLERHDVGDVCVTINCQDRPAVPAGFLKSAASTTRPLPGRTHQSGPTKRPLLLSYMSSVDHLDVPWPDYLFWGRKAKVVGPWEETRTSILEQSRQVAYKSRENMIYGASVVLDGPTFESRMKPLRQASSPTAPHPTSNTTPLTPPHLRHATPRHSTASPRHSVLPHPSLHPTPRHSRHLTHATPSTPHHIAP